MRKFEIFVVLLAAFALGAIAVASASAAVVWDQAGAEVKEATAAQAHGTLTFNKEGLVNVTVLCSVLFVGTVGPRSKDLVSGLENLSGTEKNLILCESHTTAACGGKVVVHSENLPWNTELLTLNPIRDDFTEDGKGTPAWLLLCETGLIKEVLCAKAGGWANFVANGANGAKFEFTKESTETTCSDGSKGWLTGTIEFLGFTI